MTQEPADREAAEPETESSEHLEEEVPTEDQEAPAPETQAGDLATVEVLAQEIEDLRARAGERDEFLDKLQRARADFANYQKRQDRERERWNDDARRGFALSVLPVIDDLELAFDAAKRTSDPQAIVRGFELIHTKLLAVLRDQGVIPFEALGKSYDPAYHEAAAQIEKPDVPDHTVVEVLRRGFMLRDALLRPARVVVAKGGKATGDGSANS